MLFFVIKRLKNLSAIIKLVQMQVNKNKLNNGNFLSNRANKKQGITDRDVELFKQENNLKNDREAISYLINKLASQEGRSNKA